MQLDLTDEESAALFRELNNLIEKRSLPTVAANSGAARYPGNAPGRATRPTACRTANAGGTRPDAREPGEGP
jgi:hypothetical protein